MSNYKFVNICGLGFVGGSVAYVCRQNDMKYSVYDVIDKTDEAAVGIFKDVSEFVKNSEKENDLNFYFISVPTPCRPNGECNTSIVETVVDQLFNQHTKRTIILVKSTVQPGTCRKLHSKYFKDNMFEIVFVPEFLTEVRANLDMYEAKFSMFGTYDGSYPNDVVDMFKKLYKHNSDMKVVYKKFEACEIFKYTVNCFLGVKVWFFNEIYEICEHLGIEYNDFRTLLPLEPRVGMAHTLVPGPDGKFGFGGACLVKENRALSYFQNTLGIPNTVLTEIGKRNQEIRSKQVNN